jgi:hypothetical protein
MAKRIKIPKRIAGVKIPKGIRKGPIADFLNSSGGQVVLAEALLAFGAFYASRRIDPDTPAADLLRHPIDRARAKLAGHGLGDGALASAPDRLARAFRAGVRAFRSELHETASDAVGTAEEVLEVDATGAEVAPESEVTKKKPSPSRGEASRREGTSNTH